ncbi:hypothetical protein [Nocardia seriolae]|uniref:Uncharacterized protein n=1 Tax=Nocardia seriolae TaxID=37332 RepID=A0A0B8NA02_9NOCA|nr:hypothetical protein [Nocardia seriolae]APB00733.1 hypothetical protein NS506_06702 [Nocardia seriolae]MTJ65294.1 hypothetical protein [Nocardia seriolae]MTJ74157.1 hypothetical protein [Nocardia seriolae]MTJ90179.1 hypothetical protein [Nocardia seriolae]MTK34142.1 hypothetical protein [Nocardia seriolae]
MTGSTEGKVLFDSLGEALTHRVTVYLGGPDDGAELTMEYAATWKEASDFTVAAVHAGLAVTVDGRIRPGLRRLPRYGFRH